MMRFSFVFLFVAMFMLNSILSNPKLSAAAAAAAAAVAAFETPTLKSDEVECGISSANVAERIIGGEQAAPHAWPWQALVVCDRGVVCGGSLVADKWVIASAYCLSYNGVSETFNINECQVYLGKHYSSTSNEVEPTQVIIGIEKYILHEQYRGVYYGNNIALLKLNKAVQYDKNVKPICLPFGLPELKNTSICYATGWGRIDRSTDKAEIAETLKQLQMPIQDYSYCNFGTKLLEQNICAGSWDRKDDVCGVDMGGPLACRETDGKWYLRGVASYAKDGCESVASFTKVTAFRDWIQEKMK